MKTTLLFCFILIGWSATSQTETEQEDSLKEYYGNEVNIHTKDYMATYNRLKKIIVKVYPYALYASDLIDEIDQNAESISRRRKKNAYYKDSYKSLKEEFRYFLLDLYTSEGVMLMKLIHRETGMTVFDISSKYQSKQKAEIFNLMAKIWDQDLHATFDTTDRNDRIAEHVILDIQNGLIPFANEVVKVEKEDYQEKQKAEQERIKNRKKQNQQFEKERKQRLRDEQKIQKQRDKYHT